MESRTLLEHVQKPFANLSMKHARFLKQQHHQQQQRQQQKTFFFLSCMLYESANLQDVNDFTNC